MAWINNLPEYSGTTIFDVNFADTNNNFKNRDNIHYQSEGMRPKHEEPWDAENIRHSYFNLRRAGDLQVVVDYTTPGNLYITSGVINIQNSYLHTWQGQSIDAKNNVTTNWTTTYTPVSQELMILFLDYTTITAPTFKWEFFATSLTQFDMVGQRIPLAGFLIEPGVNTDDYVFEEKKCIDLRSIVGGTGISVQDSTAGDVTTILIDANDGRAASTKLIKQILEKGHTTDDTGLDVDMVDGWHALEIVSLSNPYNNVILSDHIGVNGYPDLIEEQAGPIYRLNSSILTNPLKISFSGGTTQKDGITIKKEFVVEINDNTGTEFALNLTGSTTLPLDDGSTPGNLDTTPYWLCVDRNPTTGLLTYGAFLEEPFVGATEPSATLKTVVPNVVEGAYTLGGSSDSGVINMRRANLHWFDTSSNEMKVRNAGDTAWVVVQRVFIGKTYQTFRPVNPNPVITYNSADWMSITPDGSDIHQVFSTNGILDSRSQVSGQVLVQWVKGTLSEDNYQVEWADNSSFTGSTIETPTTDFSFELTGIVNTTQPLWFKVHSFNGVVAVDTSNTVSVTPDGADTPPSTPFGIKYSLSEVNNEIILWWNSPPDGTQVVVEYKTTAGSWPGTVAVVSTTKLHTKIVTGLTGPTLYDFRVGYFSSGFDFTNYKPSVGNTMTFPSRILAKNWNFTSSGHGWFKEFNTASHYTGGWFILDERTDWLNKSMNGQLWAFGHGVPSGGDISGDGFIPGTPIAGAGNYNGGTNQDNAMGPSSYTMNNLGFKLTAPNVAYNALNFFVYVVYLRVNSFGQLECQFGDYSGDGDARMHFFFWTDDGRTPTIFDTAIQGQFTTQLSFANTGKSM